MYEVKLQQFAGPLGKLLELIEAKQLEITTINLADVTADFIKYVQNLEKSRDSQILADFLVVAAQLVLIKSKILLPSLELTDEEGINIQDLETRLKLYKEFKQASQYLGELWNKKYISLARPLLLSMNDSLIFYPPRQISINDLIDNIQRLVNEFKEFLPEATQKIKQTIVSLETKMKELFSRLQTAMEHSFQNLTQAKPKQEIIVLFLALLHLTKDRVIKVEQGDQFGDIIVKKVEQL
ncbi:MAG: segregation/condensation protein A [bacterium]|nr:segregation/condensation protein A [bacterium]